MGVKAPGTDPGTQWAETNLMGQCVLFDRPLDLALALSHRPTVPFPSIYPVYVCTCACFKSSDAIYTCTCPSNPRDGDVKTWAQIGGTGPRFPHL